MKFVDFLAKARGVVRRKQGKHYYPYCDIDTHQLPSSAAPKLLAKSSTELEKLFYTNKDRIVDKWTHYLPIYDRHLAKYRDSNFKMLEIGVFKGGSLQLWRKYFGPNATIFGIDIDPDCAGYVDVPNQVRIGSQADPDFLHKVVNEMGGIDVILDDGSHIAEHQMASFKALFPLLADGGMYIIEDLHTSYWAGGFQGGFRRSGTGIELVKALIDDMHGWYHPFSPKLAPREVVSAVHFYDSIAIIEKTPREKPMRIKVGADAL